jgi:hypothetical protein
MPTIMISILPDGAIPVDKMSDGDNGDSCPLPTQDDALNAENRAIAIDEAAYGSPIDPTKICGNCAAYNQSDEMLKCIEDDSEELGYCQIWKFVCESVNACDSWAEGGPITSDKQADYKDIL